MSLRLSWAGGDSQEAAGRGQVGGQVGGQVEIVRRRLNVNMEIRRKSGLERETLESRAL